ncbi:hypothetical protein CNECB9_4370004 [Cupriavidus necator]|uniref:Uncharacterized protein n=1 Tax=Cupriavidus necator TaxID=106590 RepID=A0A1K0JT06_CUPNE|nr:hypothetical protein CNECB9_4370004 [Cupriavidus necator]
MMPALLRADTPESFAAAFVGPPQTYSTVVPLPSQTGEGDREGLND